VYPAVPLFVVPHRYTMGVSGDNPSGADNQQGRPSRALTPQYIAGFVDGEGCFSVSIHPHPTVRYGTRWLVAPCFQVYQLRSNVRILERIQTHFAVGRIAQKGPNSSVMTYSVYRRSDLESVIIPFFDANPLVSEKYDDFQKFRRIVLAMQLKEHRTEAGFREIVEVAFSMNQRGKQRRYRLEEVLDGTLRDCTPSADLIVQSVKIQSEPCGDAGRPAEMTGPDFREVGKAVT
jgi:hypothetical protein